MNRLIKIVELFTTKTGIKFGMDKCQTLNIRRAEVAIEGFETGEITEPMDGTDTYKYHNIIQYGQNEHTKIKKKLTTELATTLQKPFKTKLNSNSLTIWWLLKCTVKVILQYLQKIQWYISVGVVQNYD